MRRILRSALVVLGGIAVATCADGPTAPRTSLTPLRKAEVALAPKFAAGTSEIAGRLRASNISVDQVRIALRRANGATAIDTTFGVVPGDTLRLELSIDITGAQETLRARIEVMDGHMVLYAGEVDVTATADGGTGSPPPPVPITVGYVGPGASAAQVRIAPRDSVFPTTARPQVAAIVTDAAGVAIANVPIIWTLSDASAATIDPVTGTITPANRRGSVTLTAETPTGLTDALALRFTSPPEALTTVSGGAQNGTAGAPLAAPWVVEVRAADGLPLEGEAVQFTGPPGASFEPATAVSDAAGRVSTTITLAPATGTQQFTATLGALTATAAADAAAGAPASIVAVSGSGQTAQAGTALPAPFVVRVTDSHGNPTSGIAVHWAVASGGGSLSGDTTSTISDGTASTTLTLGAAAGANTVSATIAGGASAEFTAQGTAGAAARIEKLAGDLQTVVAGTPVPIAPAVQVTDAAGNATAGTLVILLSGPGIPEGSSTTASTDASGSLTLGAGVLDRPRIAGTYHAAVQLSGLPESGVLFTLTVVPAPAAQLAIVSAPDSATSGVALDPAPVVQVRDSIGNAVPAEGIAVTASAGSGASASGTVTATTDAAGAATFTGLVLTAPEGPVDLLFTAPGVEPAGASVHLAQGDASTIVFRPAAPTGGITVETGAQLPDSLSVATLDAAGNAVPGTPVRVIVRAGSPAGPIVADTTVDTDGTGELTTSALDAPVVDGTYHVRFSLLHGDPPPSVELTLIVESPAPPPTSGVASVSVTPANDTLFSFGDTRALVAQALDTTGAAIAGTFTWTSRNPAAVTVDSSGLTTAIGNGSAWIVATEADGLRDSALVVVQQRVATISVTPAVRTIYNGGTQAYAAAAVDGRGNAIGSPSFTWSSSVPGVATVDSTGLAVGVGIGTTEIRATSGSVVGVATLTVQSPIRRIAVGIDSAGVPVADTTSLPSLGARRRLVAVAYDTLDQPMTGIAFTWSTTNGSVAVLDTLGSTYVVVRAAANGFAGIRATAQGVAGSTTLQVQQRLASITLTPATATIAPTGSVALLARGADANGFNISGGSFSFASSDAGVATVDATSGVVTGVALGSANVTATAGGVTSSAAVITVSNSVPAAISFGRDSLAIGRGTSASIPVFLSRPHASPVTVNLAVADTFATFSSATLTFSAGQTAVNATLVGNNAGVTHVFATDGSGTGFAGDTAVLAVQASVRMASTFYQVNSADQLSTQVLLSDPSPPSGTYVTLDFAAPNVAVASPNPAYIPPGQLAADVVISGTSTASSHVDVALTPSAVGVNGTASTVRVHPALLRVSSTFVRIGEGQYPGDRYIHIPHTTSQAMTVTLTSSDTMVATVTPQVTIPAGSYYAYFRTIGRGAGTATITPSAPGWTAATSMAVTVTSPRISVCCSTTMTTTAPTRDFTVYATDSLGSAHYRVSSLVARVTSSDTSVLRVLDTLVTIAPNNYYTSSGRVAPGAVGGTAWLIVTAGGHGADSIQYTIVGPKLSWNRSSHRIGAGQQDHDLYVHTPHNVMTALPLTVTSTDSAIVAIDSSGTVPAGSYYRYLLPRAKAPGTAMLIVSAPGYSPDTVTYIVTTPRVGLSGNFSTPAFAPPRGFTVYARDSVNNSHYRTDSLRVSLVSTDTSVVRVDSIAVIRPGQYHVDPVATIGNPGSALVVASAPGHGPDTMVVTVTTPKIQFNRGSYRLGARQKRHLSDFYVHVPHNRPSDLAVTLTQANGAVIGLAQAALTIPTGTYYAYFEIAGLTTGVDTVIVNAPGYNPDTVYLTVTTPHLTAQNLPSGLTTTSPAFDRAVYASDSAGGDHYSMDTVVVKVTSSDTTVLRPAAEYVRILPGGYYTHATINVVGPGSASITYSDSAGSGYRSVTSNTVTVTGPSLAISRSSFSIGMRQSTGTSYIYVHVPNTVVAPLVVNLATSSTRVATVPASVTIPAGSYYAYFPVEAQDTVGTVQIQATATGYNPAASTVQVTTPIFEISTSGSLHTTSAPTRISVYTSSANGTSFYVTEPVTITLASSAPGVATVDSTTVTIPAGSYYNNNAMWAPVAAGTAQLSATDTRAVYHKYATATRNISVTTPKVHLSWNTIAVGIGQYTTDYYVSTPDNQTVATPVAFSRIGTARTTTSAATIPAGLYYSYFRITGTSTGRDSLVATIASPAHNPDTAYVQVGPGRIDPIGGWPASIAAGDSVQLTLYARAPDQDVRRVAEATTFALSANANIEFRSGGAVVTSVTIPADADRVTFYVKGVVAGSGSATITATNYTTYTNTTTVNP